MFKLSNIIKRLEWLMPKNSLPYWVIIVMDFLIVVVSGILARVLHLSGVETLGDFMPLTYTWCCYGVAFLITFIWQRTYTGLIRYTSFIDLGRIALANLSAIAILGAVRYFTDLNEVLERIDWTEMLIAFAIATVLMWAVRIGVKYAYDVIFASTANNRVFIYGVKEGGMAIARSLKANESMYKIAGFISDDSHDVGHRLMDARIYANNDKIVERMRQQKATILMVSPLKNDALRENQHMVDLLTEAGIKIMTYSDKAWDGKSDLKQSSLREVEIDELLPRDQIEIDLDKISSVMRGQCIMITGAAGSIGSEIVRQVASFGPSHLVLIDQAETPLHDIRLMMARRFPQIPCVTLTASITNRIHMESMFQRFRPQYVFHAAAYKHVPMMEDNPGEAVANNIAGTRVMADLAVKYHACKFVMVSTDKAVNPTNVMGCSKRICEIYCQSLDRAIKKGVVKGVTEFVTTRFGNVLGSNGSVIPLFREQIKNGGPVTVTHPDIIRFFMLIPEACKLVLQAGVMGHGGEIYVFDMGKPVKIADLAKRMIRLSGASDVEIVYTGLREGEKLYEELLAKEENTMPSSHPKIKLAHVRELDYIEARAKIDGLVEVTRTTYDDMMIVAQMKSIVPEFKSNNSKYEVLDHGNAETVAMKNIKEI